MFLKKVFRLISARLNYFYTYAAASQFAPKKVVQPAYWVEFSAAEKKFLEHCAESFNYEVDYTRGYRQKEMAVYTIPAVTFLGNSGALVKNNTIIKESVFDSARLTKSPAFRSPALLTNRNRQGWYTSIMHLPWAAASNYHWFLDCLPRLYALLQTINVPTILIMPAQAPAFQQETLRFLIQNNAYLQVASISKKEKWHLPEFVLANFISNHNSGYLPRAVADFIRTNIWSGYGVAAQPQKTRIYISRAKAKKRRLLTEKQLLPILLAYNFQIIYAEEFSYAEQVQLFYNAEIVAGAHGAGLTNILFGRNLKVIELHPQDMVRSHYFMICKALDFEYYYLLGSHHNQQQDFKIEANALQELLQKVIK